MTTARERADQLVEEARQESLKARQTQHIIELTKTLFGYVCSQGKAIAIVGGTQHEITWSTEATGPNAEVDNTNNTWAECRRWATEGVLSGYPT